MLAAERGFRSRLAGLRASRGRPSLPHSGLPPATVSARAAEDGVVGSGGDRKQLAQHRSGGSPDRVSGDLEEAQRSGAAPCQVQISSRHTTSLNSSASDTWTIASTSPGDDMYLRRGLADRNVGVDQGAGSDGDEAVESTDRHHRRRVERTSSSASRNAVLQRSGSVSSRHHPERRSHGHGGASSVIDGQEDMRPSCVS